MPWCQCLLVLPPVGWRCGEQGAFFPTTLCLPRATDKLLYSVDKPVCLVYGDMHHYSWTWQKYWNNHWSTKILLSSGLQWNKQTHTKQPLLCVGPLCVCKPCWRWQLVWASCFQHCQTQHPHHYHLTSNALPKRSSSVGVLNVHTLITEVIKAGVGLNRKKVPWHPVSCIEERECACTTRVRLEIPDQSVTIDKVLLHVILTPYHSSITDKKLKLINNYDWLNHHCWTLV